MSRYKETMGDVLFLIREGYSPKEIKMAIGIASDPRYKGGNYSGAVDAIEKIKKGLSNHKQVAAVLKRQNEDIQESGHDDVKSAKNQVQIAMSALEKMNAELSKLNDEDSLPTWWTNKVAVAVDKLDGMADYLDTQVEEVELDEGTRKSPNRKEYNELLKKMKSPIKAKDAVKMIKKYIVDDELQDDIEAIASRRPNEDVVPIIKKRLESGDIDLPEEVELDEMKEPFAVVDTADGDKVVGTASSEKGAKEIISTAQLPPMKIKDKKTLKIVKTRKKQMIGYPLKEDVDLGKLDEALPPHLAKLFDKDGNFKDPKKQKVFDKMMGDGIGKEIAQKMGRIKFRVQADSAKKKVMVYVDQNDESDAQKALKNHPAYVSGALRVIPEEVELEENVFKELQITAKDLAKYASKDKKSMDYKDFMKAAAMMKTGKIDQLVKHTNDLDTEPRDVIIMMVKDAIGKQAAERLFKVSIS